MELGEAIIEASIKAIFMMADQVGMAIKRPCVLRSHYQPAVDALGAVLVG